MDNILETSEIGLANMRAKAAFEKDREIIKEHLDTKFLDALKRMFNYDAPSISFHRNYDGTALAGQDYNMTILNGAIRDGQREVIATLEHIFRN